MSIAARHKALESLGRLNVWVASNPCVPLVKGKANRTAICKRLGIARSTADSNPLLRAVFLELDAKVLSGALASSKNQKTMRETTNADVAKLSSLKQLAKPRNSESLTVTHLLNTGRVVR